jgi:hypothetical protein
MGSRRSSERSVAKGFTIEVEKFRGAESTAASFKKTRLVVAKLEMVRAAWLPHLDAIVCRFCWLSRLNRIQRDEID